MANTLNTVQFNLSFFACEIAHSLREQGYVLACALKVDDISIACKEYEHSLQA